MSPNDLTLIRKAFQEGTITLTVYPSVTCQHYDYRIQQANTKLEPNSAPQTENTHLTLEVEIEQQEPATQTYLAGICPRCKKVYAFRKGLATYEI